MQQEALAGTFSTYRRGFLFGPHHTRTLPQRGNRFAAGKTAPWCDRYLNFPPCKGGFFSIDLTAEQTPSLLAACDRSTRQSEVFAQMAVYRVDPKEPLTGGSLLSGVIGNDQFWRLVPLARPTVKLLGVHVIKDHQTGARLGEVELYP
jgi:hypothetical protein